MCTESGLKAILCNDMVRNVDLTTRVGREGGRRARKKIETDVFKWYKTDDERRDGDRRRRERDETTRKASLNAEIVEFILSL